MNQHQPSFLHSWLERKDPLPYPTKPPNGSTLATQHKDTGKLATSVQKEAGTEHRDGNNDEINVISDSDSNGEEDQEIELGMYGKPDGNSHG